MDGPHEFGIKKHSDGIWVIEFDTGRYQVSARKVVEEALLAANGVTQACVQRGWKSRDLSYLVRMASQLGDLARDL